VNPTAPGERVLALDVVRGIALRGVLLINLQTLFRESLLSYILSRPTDAISRTLHLVFEFKSMDLFCLCFGVGLAIQSTRPPSFLVRRFLVLLAFGLVHLFLIWNGDILTLYSIAGLLLIPFLRLPAIALLVLSALCFYVPINFPLPTAQAMRAQAAEALRVYPSAGVLEVVRFRIAETLHFLLPLLLAFLPKTIGLMSLGVAIWRKPIPSVIAGIVITVFVQRDITQALVYGTAIALIAPHLRWFAPLGRMALTNYVTQSIVLTTLFYGFGLFGRITPGQGVAISLTLYSCQLLLSHWWLRRYRFGPLEWLWRSLAYGRRQAFTS